MKRRIQTSKQEFNVNVWLDEELYKKLHDYSVKHDVPMSRLGRIAIRKYLDE